jgi:hypothetical protein
MSVADYFGLDDPLSPLMGEARMGWARWCADEPGLAVVDDLLDLRDWTCRAAKPDKDRVLAHLAALARADDPTRVALVWLLLPGAIALADGLRDLSPEIDDLVAGQLWIEVARSHRLPPRGMAKAILNCTRREVLAEVGVGCHGKLRDKVWSEAVLLDRFEERAVLVEPLEPDAYDELIELFDAALRDNAIEGFDIWLLHEFATVATAEAAPLRRGRCGLTSPAVVEAVARRRPEAARTLRRRVGKALDALAAYVDARRDDETLARWRADHPWRPLTRKGRLAVLAAEEEDLRKRCRGTGSVAANDASAGQSPPYAASA